MKVVQINCVPFGSTGKIARSIHSALLAHCDESHVFFGGGKSTEKNMHRIGNYFSLHSHSVLSRNLGMQGYFSHFATKKLIQSLKKISPDIVHLHNLHGSYLNLPLLFGYLKKTTVQVVITLHDCWLFTGKCPHFTSVGCNKWKENCGSCPQLAIYPKSKVDTTSKSLSDKKKWLSGFGERMHIVAVSNWLRETARESFLSQYSIHTIYNGIDCNIFRPVNGTRVREKYNLADKFVILGVASAWDDRKGLQGFFSLSERISENEIIVLVGLTVEQRSSLPKNVIGIMRTENQAELAELYSAANVFVNLSTEESFGLVVAEAMACGTPVIVYNSTACPELVVESTGFVAPPGDIDKVCEFIKNIKREEQEYTIVCRERVVEKYTHERMVGGYMVLYNDIAGNN